MVFFMICPQHSFLTGFIFFPVKVNMASFVFTRLFFATLVGFVLSWNFVHHFDTLH